MKRKTLTHVIQRPNTYGQYWTVTIAYYNRKDLQDGDYEIVSVSVYDASDFRCEITDMLNQLNLLDGIVEGIDWLQEYAEAAADALERRAEV